MNWLVLPTLLIAMVLFRCGGLLWQRARSHRAQTGVVGMALVLATPGILFAAYYVRFFHDAAWYFQLRSLPFSELAAGGAGLLAGVLAAAMSERMLIRRSLMAGILTLGIIGPHLKPVIAPLPGELFQDRWLGDVCLQTTESSCGAASAATLLRASGVTMSEAEIARTCLTYRGGTECWYLARLFRGLGFQVHFRIRRHPTDPLPVPSLAGTRLYGQGHFIAVIRETPSTYVTGDPLLGLQEWPKETVRQKFDFTGFFMEIHATK